MSETSVQITQGSGTKLRTYDRVVGGVTVHEEIGHAAEPYLPHYFVLGGALSFATTADHLVQLMAGSSLHLRVRRIHWEQRGVQTAAAELTISVIRLSTAGTGGTAITPRPFDSGDSASGATAMALPTAKGTEGVELFRRRVFPFITVPGGSGTTQWEWLQAPNEKPIIVPAGTSNGLALKVETGRAGTSTCDVSIEFAESAWL